MKDIVPKIMGWLVMIITLALAPTINQSNTDIAGNVTAATNAAKMIGMSTITSFGAPIIIIGLLVAGGFFGVAGVRGKLMGASVKDMMAVIGSVIVLIVAMVLFTSVITYVDTLITASSGFAQTIYGIIPIVLYIGIIAGAGYVQVRTYRKNRSGKRRSAARANY